MAKKDKSEGPRFIKLPRIQKELTQCQMCGYCIEVCEAHRQTPWESVTARGKIYYLNQLDKAGTGLMDKVLGRKAKLSPEFIDAMYKCTGCGNCEEVCHAKIELVALWEKIRKWMADTGLAPLPVHRKLEGSIVKNGNPYGEPKSKRDAWWPEDVKRTTPPQAVFFAGCTGSYRMQNIPQAAVRVLDRCGVTVNCLGENEVCCTSPLLRTGIVMRSLEANKEVVTKADALGAKDMVMSCSGCYKTVSSNFVQYYGKPGQNVYHITQYVEKLINERKMPMNNEFTAKVTYHDPCHLGRHSKVYDAPRNILKKIKGIDFVEMEKNRENSRCCGAGGGYKSAFNDFAVNIAAQRIRDAEAVGAEVIATACPFCVLNLKHGAKKIGSKVKVMDITEILLQVTAPKVEAPKEEPKAAPAPKEEPKAEAPKAEPVIEAPKEEPKAAPAAPAEPKMDPYKYAEDKNKAQVAAGKYDEKRAAAFQAQIDEVKNSAAPEDAKMIALGQVIGGIIGGRSAKVEPGSAAAPAAAVAAVDPYEYAAEKNKAQVAAGKYDEKRAAAFQAQIDEVKNSDLPEDQKMVAMGQVIGGIIGGRGAIAALIAAAAAGTAAEEEPKAAPAAAEAKSKADPYEYAAEKNKAQVAAGKYDEKRAAAFQAQIDEVKNSDLPEDQKMVAMGQVIGGIIGGRGAIAALIAAAAAGTAAAAASKEEESIEEAAEEPAEEDYAALEEEYGVEDFDMSSEGVVRRAAWNKGMRCRRNYGIEKIQIAFVKSKVAVFVTETGAEEAGDKKLEAKGWTVLRFKNSKITDGVEEANLIKATAKENLRNMKKAKKKKR